MKITNRHNLPEPIVAAIKRPTYSKGGSNLSVTEMIGSPRISQLRSINYDHLEMDASDGVWALFGTAIHHILEQGIQDNHVTEERLHAIVDGWTISGAIDLQVMHKDGVLIQDYKTVGAWGVMNEKPEWEQQLNIYAWLVRHVKGHHVKAIEIVAIVRDWMRRDAEYNPKYPQSQIVTIPVKLWDADTQEAYIRERIRLHAAAYFESESNGDLPLCTEDEMWEKPTVYAVKKSTNKKATAVCYSMQDATVKQESLGKDYEIEVRPGERTRCATYCQVKDFCSQWKLYNSGETK